jgi:hypothetical protein
MKKLLILGILLLMISASGCKKFLETKPEDIVSPVNYFNTEKELDLAYMAVYDPFGNNSLYGGTFEVRGQNGDDSYSTLYTAAGPWNNGHTPADANQIRPVWQILYQVIERANIVLKNIGKVEMDEKKKSVYRAEVLFLRAYAYFMLADLYGGVPLKLEPTASVNDVNRPRISVKEVYEQVLKDMKEAEPLVQTATQLGFGGKISKTAIDGILARVCLTMAGEPLKDASKWQEAKDWAMKVVNSGEHRLNPDYRDVFIKLASDKYDVKEVLWEIEKIGTNANGNTEYGVLGSLNGISGLATAFGFSFAQVQMTRKYFNLFPANNADLRRDWNIAPYRYSTTADGLPFIFWGASEIWNRQEGKYRRIYDTFQPKNNDNTGINFPVLRYADVLLMIAEAENELNGPTTLAYAMINQVRARAYGKLIAGATNPNEADLSGLDKITFRQAIQDERARELTGEALRRHDLIRWGIYVSTMKEFAADVRATAPVAFQGAAIAGDNTSERNVLWPIPDTEIINNPSMTQNPGW